MDKRCMSLKSAKITFWIAAVILVISVVLLIVFPTIYKSVLKKELTLTEGSILTKMWSDIPLPLYEKIYFFNITNEEDFLKRGAPLNVTEVGPYVYKARWVKNNPQWNSNGTVSYREVRTYHFVEERSVGSQNDTITTLNGPLILAADMLKKYNIGFRIAASFLLKLESENVIINKKVSELVYEGYDDIIIKLAPIIKPDIPYKDGKFSWLYGKNATDDGLFTVFTGADDSSKTNIINNWNGQEKLPFWSGDSCNMMNGTSVEAGPVLPENPESYSFFQSIFCRSVTFNYTGEGSVQGIKTKRFEPTYELLANSSENPDNYCFETKGPQRSGVLSLSACEFDAPLWLSFPHFYMADPSYLKHINGLEANAELHGSSLDVEPETGLSVGIQIRFQINIQISKIRGLLQFDDIQEGFFPVLWAALDVQLDQDLANFLKLELKGVFKIVYGILGVLIAVSAILLISSLVILYLYRTDNDDDPLIDIKEEEKSNISKRTINPSTGAINYGANEESPVRT